MSERGIVYILTNPYITGKTADQLLYKIGSTQNLEDRMKKLYTTGVPGPFDSLFACEVDGYEQVERILHKGFAASRTPGREFFDLSLNQTAMIIALVKRLEGAKVIKETADETIQAAALGANGLWTETAEIPEGYDTYANLKSLLNVPETFGICYFCLRVATRHQQQGVPVYKYKGKGFYRKDIFLQKAQEEGIQKDE